MVRNISGRGKKSTQTSALPSVQGAVFHTKESFEERKEKSRGKKRKILKCAPKRSRLEALLLSPSFLAPFFAAIERGTE